MGKDIYGERYIWRKTYKYIYGERHINIYMEKDIYRYYYTPKYRQDKK